MRVPKKGDVVRTLKENTPVFREWRGVTATVLDVFEHPEGNLKLELQREDGQKGIMEAVHVRIVKAAPPVTPQEIPEAEALWLAWMQDRIQHHQKEVERLQRIVRDRSP